MTQYKDGFNAGHSIRQSENTAGIMFVLEAERDNPRFDEVTILEHAAYFLEWDEHWTGKRSQIVRRNGKLYRAIHDVLDPAQNIDPELDATMQLWKAFADPTEEWPEWSQPIAGVDTPYDKGDKVTHNGKYWLSDEDQNVWEPGAWGWTEVIL